MLRAQGLYGGIVANATLTVGPGLTVITGDSGCGTTSLLRLLAGLDRSEQGSVEGGPVALLTTPPGDEWTDREVAVHALEAPHLIGREMRTLSGGERQRVRLANVLASEAQVLLLDEPLGLLDAGGRAMLLRTLKADARPVLMACKSDPAAIDAADVVLTMAEGRVSVTRQG